MLKVKLKEELASLHKDSVTQSEKFVEEVKSLMQNNSDNEKQILKDLGLGKNIIRAENETARLIVFNEIDKKYEGEVYTHEQVKYLALKYNLRFLNTAQFNGHVAAEVGSVLARFCEKNLINPKHESDRFYILAPERNFTLLDKVDPLLFYKIEHNNHGETMYKLVYKWGEDFTLFRRISGIINKSNLSIFLSYLFITLFSAFLLNVLCSSAYTEKSSSVVIGLCHVIAILGWLAAIVVTIFLCVKAASEYESDKFKGSDISWNYRYKN